MAVKKAEATATKKTGGAKPKVVKDDRADFFAEQRQLLLEERQTYISSAEALKAQADSLALEHEPGDVQFDEEGGEGGTANVDREIDLYLSAQARATVVEIDRALQKIEDGTYGVCERCGEAIPDARLQALPYAALCVTCKSGGLSSRR
ncbi:MAG: TraR/DksA C4-type zinc finger protein [Acidobacteriota bacterium]|nr:TraR/DksA C4-type zinc finger protein [Acidobacteriota bacterium]